MDLLLIVLFAIVLVTFCAWVSMAVYLESAEKAWQIILPTIKAMLVCLLIMLVGVGPVVWWLSVSESPSINFFLLAIVSWICYSVIWIVRLLPGGDHSIVRDGWYPRIGWVDFGVVFVYLLMVGAI